MARSKKNLKRKKSSGSRRSPCYIKRHTPCSSLGTAVLNDDKISQSTVRSTASTESVVQSVYDIVTYDQVPYYSWSTFFYDQEYNPNSPLLAKIDAAIEFFAEKGALNYEGEGYWNLDMNSLLNDSNLRFKWPNIAEDIAVNSNYALKCINAGFFEATMRQLISRNFPKAERVFRALQLARPNIINYQMLNPLSHVKISSYGKLVSIRGTVISVGLPKLISESLVYTCKCNYQILLKSTKNTSTLIPKRCKVCGNAKTKQALDSPYESAKDVQMIRVKDNVGQTLDGEVISTNFISVKLTGSSVSKHVPGDKIRILGIPRATLGALKPSTSGSQSLYLDAISAFPDDLGNCENLKMEISTVIQKIKSCPNIFNLLVRSLCPSVPGYVILKAALILGLFAGGPSKNDETRDYIHILVIGNMGLGKSQLLRACAQIASNGTFIRNPSTPLVSTMTSVRENPSEDFRLEAGALAEVTGNSCFLDELNKMTSQHQILYHAMDGNRISTINPELKARLPSRIPIFAMTSPSKKQYDPSKTVAENVNLNEQLISQFDLIFLLRDHPDQQLDKLTCDRLFDDRAKRGPLKEATLNRTRVDDRPSNPNTFGQSSSDILPEKMFQLYLNYARMCVKPKIGKPSKIVIEKYCLMRSQKERNMELDRILQTLWILTEARAKVDLRSETTEEDALDAIQIMENSMSMSTRDLSGPSSSNSKKLTTNKVKGFLNDLQTEARLQRKNIFSVEELRGIAGQENVNQHTFSDLLSKVNEQGYLLKITSNSYKIVLANN